jgi:hypothetical protein
MSDSEKQGANRRKKKYIMKRTTADSSHEARGMHRLKDGVKASQM